MKSIFRRDSSLHFRISSAIFIALIIISIDLKFEFLNIIRNYLDMIANPFYLLSNTSIKIFNNALEKFSYKRQIQFENKLLRKELFLKNANFLLFNHLKEENFKLKKLLGAPLLQEERVMMAEVISNTKTYYRDQIVIDRGFIDGVYDGQPIINDKGIVGQVISVNKFNSRVLLICDISHALPVQVLRNDIRMIASGNGCLDDFLLCYWQGKNDIRIGDILVTSSLGNKFPEGYPVGVVINIKYDIQRACRVIFVKPYAELKRLRYVLLLWVNKRKIKTLSDISDVYRSANYRFNKINLVKR
ncbi:rod shape-determining protein MreC [Candidatus Providencia siddallii]|uniref:Cell shape-determining protein MreC n=1 Tax=Candidatus Providencia siddallii TaxID=1715285 RepID=A0ABM9NPE8_9GAMM